VTFTCKAFLFDLDGVLVDSTRSVARIWKQWALDHNLDPGLVVAHAHGRRSIEIIRQFAPQLDAEQENHNVENMEITDTEGIVAIPGALEFLRRLPPDRFSVVTSATRPLARARLQYAGFPSPQNSVTAEDVVNGKPHPDPYLKGAASLNVAPADCVVFEDTPAGIQAGKNAGMQVVAFTTTRPAEELKMADAIVPSFNGLKVEFVDGTFRLKAGH
jgi:mannitol-1-/sugar-/sorbitol-6-phosphatase